MATHGSPLPFAFCHACGHAYPPEAPWPRLCQHCQHRVYRNPLPVVAILQPCARHDGAVGVLLIQRGIEPCRGQWALPGGFLECGEDWRVGAARELFEETGLSIAAPEREITAWHVASNGRADRLLVFGLAPTLDLDTLPPFTPNAETLAWAVAFDLRHLAFPAHTEALQRYFAQPHRGPCPAR